MKIEIIDILTKISKLASDFQKLINDNYSNPLLWLVIFIILLVIAYVAISALSNK